MDIIQFHVNEFEKRVLDSKLSVDHFVSTLNKYLSFYHSTSHKLFFLEKIFLLIKNKHDKHSKFCNSKVNSSCRFFDFYTFTMYYIVNEIEKISKSINSTFKISSTNFKEEKIICSVTEIDASFFYNYSDYEFFRDEITQMKSFYYLDKKSWEQLFIGKITYMTMKNILSKDTAKLIINELECA